MPHISSTHTNLCRTQARHPRLVGAVGTLDGLKLPVEVSSESHIENAMYNGWLHSHFVSNVIAFAPTGLVIPVGVSQFSTKFSHRRNHSRIP